jgi:predicted CXXCH cytochrome family protein
MKSRFNTLALVAAVLLLMSGVTYAQGDAGCTKPKCHADKIKHTFVHGPVGAGICTVCHNPVEGKDHEFVMAAEKEELCFNCHDRLRDMMLENSVHTPVAEGNCTGCHDPHGTEYRFQLKGQAADLCFQCHEKEEFGKEFVHGPVAVGDCNACHSPHASEYEKQLLNDPAQLCFQCHKEQEGIMQKRHQHKPVTEKCTKCHSPHSNVSKFMLPAPPPILCIDCHAELATYASLQYQHEPVATGQCKQCHDPHASDFPRLFPTTQSELCFRCHEDLGKYITTQAYRHGPTKDGDCNACHNPHGSENYRLLRLYFPKEFYVPYAPENYALCFKCHNKDIALEERTTTLTDFRDKDRNLHFLHVNKQVKGRSCKACHQVHASNQAKHIRTSVPFGKIKWELPVTYTKSEDGGKCVVGCHAPKEYHRK